MKNAKWRKRGVSKYASHRGHKTVVLCFSNFHDKDNAFPLYSVLDELVNRDGDHTLSAEKGAY